MSGVKPLLNEKMEVVEWREKSKRESENKTQKREGEV
jgi:hypothetical protein